MVQNLGRFRPPHNQNRPWADPGAWQLLDHHLRLPDEQGGFRTDGRNPRINGIQPGIRGI